MRPLVSRRPFSFVLASLGLACFVDEGGSTTGAATGTDSTAAATDAATSTTPTEPSTTTDTTTTTTTTTDDTLDLTTDAPADCWQYGVQAWPNSGDQIVGLLDAVPASPYITPDGLGLYYIAASARRPFLSLRPALDQPFPNGSQLALWSELTEFLPTNPVVILDGQEMLLSDGADIHYSAFAGGPNDVFTAPLPLDDVVNSADFNESVPSATADGRTLIVQRDDGPAVPPFAVTWRFYQFDRADPKPGAPFTLTGERTPVVGTLGLAVCPTLSPDGLHLLFTSTAEPTIETATISAIDIYYAVRPDRAAPWDTPQRVPGLDTGDDVPCPVSVTADGCHLAYTSANILDVASLKLFLARRLP
jgi:hypothetical protein